MKKYDWKNEYNPIRRTAKRLLSGEPLTDGRPLSDLIELDEHTRKCLAFEATLTDRQIDMLQELGYLPVIMRQYGEECANCPYTLDEREHGICRRCAVFIMSFDDRFFFSGTIDCILFLQGPHHVAQKIHFTSVDLPSPFLPTKATFSPR